MDVRVAISYTMIITPAEFRILSKALRGRWDDLTPGQQNEALALQRQMLEARARTLTDAAASAAKNAANAAEGGEE